CAAHHLWVIIRPGPYICAEWNAGGFPNWLAYKEIGNRTDTPMDLKWSKYYYNEVLPVIRKHLITNGGNVILMQLENKYDYSRLPDTLRTHYIRSLYQDAKNNNIDVPLITCWTSVVRNNTDPVLSQIMDADNFYPGYHLKGVGESIQSMIRTEPNSPPMITELQGGWFSHHGGKAIRYPNKYGSNQVNDLTKYVIAHGVDAFNYYMGYGGTNFGYWGAAGITSSYDYTAPITEVGGLWKKYRAVKLIGDFLNSVGNQYAHMPKVWGEASTNTPGIELIMRGKDQQRILFVRNTMDTSKVAHISLKEGMSHHHITVQMPKNGAKFLLINEKKNDITVRNANIQFSQIRKIGNTPFLLGYGKNGEQANFTIDGTTVHKTLNGNDQWISSNGTLVALTSWKRAARTRVFGTGNNSVALISDSYLINKKRIDRNRYDLSVKTRPGEDHFVVVSDKKIRRVRANRHRVHVRSEKKNGLYLNSFTLSTGNSPFHSIPLHKAEVKTEPVANVQQGQSIKMMKDGTYGSLGMNGLYDNGYFSYRGTIQLPTHGFIKMSFYNSDWHGVYIDHKFIPELSGSSYSNTVNLEKIAGNGEKSHEIRIIYENGSRLNFPDVIRKQLKGLVSITYESQMKDQKLSKWKLSPHPAGPLIEKPVESRTWFDDRHWPTLKVTDWRELYQRGLANQTSSWYRNYFTLNKKEARDSNIHLDFQAVYGDATVFINGHKVTEQKGRYTSFNVALAGLVHPGQNSVAVYIDNEKGLGGLYRPAVLKFTGQKIPVHLKVKEGLNGKNEGWTQSGRVKSFNAKSTNIDQTMSDSGHIVWYRTTFDLKNNREWHIPIAAKLKASGDIQIWINGHLAGRYFAQG
ncbi:MAG TPA: beta-galactosidase, partial [Balneolales bacterium]|nr:beta-galactosidase [Balneolales bacterium]